MRLNSDMFFCSVPVVYFGWWAFCYLIDRRPNWILGDGATPNDPFWDALVESGWSVPAVVAGTLMLIALIVGNIVIYRRMRRSAAALAYWRSRNERSGHDGGTAIQSQHREKE
jgi:hypothetical protein